MFSKLVSKVEWVALVCAAIALVLMLSITTISVLGRYLFASPVPDDIVFNELLMVALVFLPLSFVQRNDQHIHVSLLFDRLSTTGRNTLHLFGTVVATLFFLLLSYATYADFYSAFQVLAYNEGVLELPEYPFRFILFLGVVIMLVRLILQCLIQLEKVVSKFE